MTSPPLTVTQLTAHVRGALSASPALEDCLVEGELSNLSTPVSGHLYFTLKDAGASVRCVAFRTQAQRIPFRPENGMTVIAHGRVDLYDKGGTYQLYVDRLEPSGLGALALAVEQTRRRLAEAGLLDDALKRHLPVLPRRVVVVTSRTGAALRDVITVIRRRAPGVDLVLSPATVQGAAAADAVITALERAGNVRHADVILLVRGGGSGEDMAAFNDERVARAVRAAPIPVVTGIGHETDVCIADLVADRRGATPSAAAELVVPVAAQLRVDLLRRRERLGRAVAQDLAVARTRLATAELRLRRVSPARSIAGERQTLDGRRRRLASALTGEVGLRRRHADELRARLRLVSPAMAVPLHRHRLHRQVERLGAAFGDAATARRRILARRLTELDRAATQATPRRRRSLNRHQERLDDLSPRRVLERGYSITLGADGVALRDARDLRPGQRLQTVLARGEVQSEVVNTSPGANPSEAPQ